MGQRTFIRVRLRHPPALPQEVHPQGPGLIPHVDYYTHLLWRQLALGPVINTLVGVTGATATTINVTLGAFCYQNDGVSKV
jgi:hypothetical protein